MTKHMLGLLKEFLDVAIKKEGFCAVTAHTYSNVPAGVRSQLRTTNLLTSDVSRCTVTPTTSNDVRKRDLTPASSDRSSNPRNGDDRVQTKVCK